ncbi:MAG: hypothetical protein NTX29_06865 [Actinobacteria bacterium]|nr:hypothetical protein [Actinomycetota bacterium]
MSKFAEPQSVEPLVRGLLGGIDVAGGPTDEQVAVLRSFSTHLFGRPDLDPATLIPLGPEQTASELADDAAARRHFHWLHVALEACRHPQEVEQVRAVEAYAQALHVDGADLALFRTLVDDGTVRAAADYKRFGMGMLPRRGEAALEAGLPSADEADPALVARLEAFADMPDDSLGRAYLAFYERFGLTLPGSDASILNNFFVSHDMTHVISGISTTAVVIHHPRGRVRDAEHDFGRAGGGPRPTGGDRSPRSGARARRGLHIRLRSGRSPGAGAPTARRGAGAIRRSGPGQPGGRPPLLVIQHYASGTSAGGGCRRPTRSAPIPAITTRTTPTN